MGDEPVKVAITIHRSELIRGGRGARIGYSDDHPDRVFLVMPGQCADGGSPRCECGCALVYSDECHRWLCPHCDDLDDNAQQTS